MTTQDIFSAVAGPAGALVVLLWIAWLYGTDRICSAKARNRELADKDGQLAAKDREIADWKAAWASERARADAGVLAAQTANQVLSALHREVTG